MMNLTVPLSTIVSEGAVQFVEDTSELTCRLNPVEVEGQYTSAVLVLVSRTPSNGVILSEGGARGKNHEEPGTYRQTPCTLKVLHGRACSFGR